MRITDFLDARHPFPTLEIIPPQSGIVKDELLDNIAPLMEFKPRYINVTTHRDEVRYTPKGDGSFLREVVRSRVSPSPSAAASRAGTTWKWSRTSSAPGTPPPRSNGWCRTSISWASTM